MPESGAANLQPPNAAGRGVWCLNEESNGASSRELSERVSANADKGGRHGPRLRCSSGVLVLSPPLAPAGARRRGAAHRVAAASPQQGRAGVRSIRFPNRILHSPSDAGTAANQMSISKGDRF